MDSSDEYLQISGIQHFAFCPRQWGLIHIEQQWQENDLTYAGRKLHTNVDKPDFREVRGNTITTRSFPLISHRLKVVGIADMVEYVRGDHDGIPLPGRDGVWLPRPVEYKHGESKVSSCDRVQLCTQAMCLEEMFDVKIPCGDIFFGRPRRRERVELDNALRDETIRIFAEMVTWYQSGSTPPAIPSKQCGRCSLENLCVPQLSHLEKVRSYVDRQLKLE